MLCSKSKLGEFVHSVALSDPRFTYHGRKWVCIICNLHIKGNKLPPMALVNMLTPAWHASPAILSSLSSLEREVLASHLESYQPFEKVSELRHGVCANGPPVKTLHIISSKPVGKGFTEAVSRQGCPPGHKLELRVRETTAAYRHLIEHSRMHKISAIEEGAGEEHVQGVLQQKVEDFQARLELVLGAHGTVEILPGFLPLVPTVDEPVDWFARFGPRFARIHSILVPDLDPKLPPEWSSFVEKGADAVYRGLSFLQDQHCVAPPSAPRSPELSFGDWLLSRLANCTREGLANDPEMLLALYTVSQFGIALLPSCCISLLSGETWHAD